MITLIKKLKVLGDNPPFTYSVQADSCASITTNSPTNDIIEIIGVFETENCINQNITVVGYDKNNCKFTYTFSFANVCDDLSILPITKNGNTYTVTANNANCDNLTFDWEYNTNVFSQTNINTINNQSSITLVNSLGYTSTDTIKVTVTDCKGCTKQEALTVNLCRPTVQDFTVTLVSTNDPFSIGYTSGVYTLPNPTICDQAIDWSTLSFSPNNLVNVTNLNNGTVSFSSNSSLGDVYTSMTYTVKDYAGRVSNVGTVNFIEEPVTVFFAFSFNATVPASVVDGTTYNIPLQTPIGNPDYSTMEILSVPEYQSSSITFDEVTNSFVYTKTATISTDIFSYRLKDQQGNYSNIATVSVNIPQAAFAVQDRAVCMPCGLTDDYPVQVTTGTLNTVEIISTENGITATVLPNNNVQLTVPVVAFNGTASDVVIRGTDIYGNTDTATITVNSVCAGTNPNNTIDTCQADVTPFDDLGIADDGGTWSTTTGSPLPSPFDSQVTLPATGTHEYTYTIPPSHDCAGIYNYTLVYEYQAPSAVVGDTCGTAISLTAIAGGEGTSSTTNHTTIATCPFSISAARAVTGWTGTIAADKFFSFPIIPISGATNIKITATVDSTPYSTNPLLNPKIAILSDACDATNIVVNDYQTSRINTASYTRANPGAPVDILIQIGSTGVGRFDVSVTVEQV